MLINCLGLWEIFFFVSKKILKFIIRFKSYTAERLSRGSGDLTKVNLREELQ